MKNGKKVIALSAIAILMLGSSAYAGKIITDAGDPANPQVVPGTQYGFGGWNYDNVDVRIVNVADFSTPTLGTFDTETGDYTEMGENMSFESDIKNAEGTVLGHLHGKDWPVGEPSGIKIINDDMGTQHGKPTNCIMTSSYQAGGYLDSGEPNPVICSSPFQTHKRYKINLLPTTVDGIAPGQYGKPVDLIFNLEDGDTSFQRYQLLQKANNYTGMRLDGYKVEVLDATGAVNPALTLSLGLGEGLNKDTGEPDSTVDIWQPEDMANMSHGLWGPIDDNFEQPGFFDSARAFYTVELNEANNTISHMNGDMEGGNYQALFGNWLPSVWEPTGIFHDHDDDPETDGVIMAYLGIAPGFTERAWYKNTIDIIDPKKPVYTWSLATDADFAAWTGDLYEEGPIEDVLNLGLNYIIEIGDNAAIGSTFILRITPHVDTNQTPPSSHVSNDMDPKYDFEASADFNNDGIDDVLWRDPSTGLVVLWYMYTSGTHIEKEIGSSGLTYNIESAADFNADGIADVLWRNPTTGDTGIWYMKSDGTATWGSATPSGTTYNIEAAADFNNDSRADVLWRNPTTGDTGIWYMNSNGKFNWGSATPSGTAFNIEAAADFNNDGRADVLWRNPTTGDTGIWYMNKNRNFAWGSATPSGTTYNIEAAADFNNDGRADVLWRNPTTGDTGIWYMNSSGNFNWASATPSDTTYDIAAAADFNNDGLADIFWRDLSTGDNLIWYMTSDGTYN